MKRYLFLVLILSVAACSGPQVVVNSGTSAAVEEAQTSEHTSPRNVIFFIADGCGPASVTMARDYIRATTGRTKLYLDDFYVGSVSTYASDARVTDSAASATAYACGVKTKNGAIAVDANGNPVPTILEAAELRGMSTGLIATSRITHATPASFAAHAESRRDEESIARQELAHGIELIVGGGKRFFMPKSMGGSREDEADLLDHAAELGYTVALDRQTYENTTELPLLALFSDDHMAYEIDRDPAAEPSLAEMVEKGIGMLDGSSDSGFLLIVEGSRIDHAGHDNDAAAHLHDILAFDDAIKVATDYARLNGETLVISTSDHETGGMTLGRIVDGRSIYDWKPEVLAGVSSSFGVISDRVSEADHPEQKLEELIGIDVTPGFADSLVAARGYAKSRLLSSVISTKAIVGWTTNGHSAVDVPMFAYGVGSGRFNGFHDNVEIAHILVDLLGLDMGAAKEALSP